MLLSFDDGDYIKMTEKVFEVKTAKNKTVTKVASNPMLKNLNLILSACMSGDFDKVTKDFDISAESDAGEWRLTMSPKNGKFASKLSRILLCFDKKDMSLNTLRMEEKSGDYTEYGFRTKQFNRPMPEGVFPATE